MNELEEMFSKYPKLKKTFEEGDELMVANIKKVALLKFKERKTKVTEYFDVFIKLHQDKESFINLPKKSLLITGKSRTGKTLIQRHWQEVCKDFGIRHYFFKESEMLKDFVSFNTTFYFDLVEKIKDVKVVFIDDLFNDAGLGVLKDERIMNEYFLVADLLNELVITNKIQVIASSNNLPECLEPYDVHRKVILRYEEIFKVVKI